MREQILKFNFMNQIIGCLSILLCVGMIVGTGFLAWNWIEPRSFGSAFLFLVVWGILGSIASFIVRLIIAALAGFLIEK